MRVLFSVLLIISFFSQSVAQEKLSTNSNKAKKYYEEANLLLRQREFAGAIEYLQMAVDKDPDFIEAHNKLAFCYELLRNEDMQQKHLEEVIRINDNPQRYQNAYFLLGKVYYNQGDYQKAKQLLNDYINNKATDPRIVAQAKNFMVNVEYALENIDDPVSFDPAPMPKEVNAFPLQYFPVLTADENTIFYTTRMGISFYDDENIFVSHKNASGEWSPPEPISQNINSQFNEGTCTISADGQILIFTNCEGRPSVGGCDLFISYKEGDEWSTPKNLGPIVNSMAWDSQPSLSADGSRLYFVSDRAGGQGKRDIWLTEKDEEGRWKEPWNLGPQINTPADEVSPFIHVNNVTLYFASNGYPGFGGYDIYVAERNQEGWSDPKNLGYPLNDHNDQVSLFVSTTGDNAYYSFEKREMGRPSRSLIYTFKYPEEISPSKKSNYLTGVVLDEETQKPLNASIELIDLDKNETVSVFNSNPLTGEYFTILTEGGRYALYVDSKGYIFESRSFDYLDSDLTSHLEEDFYLEPIKKGSKTQLSNIYFDFDSYELKEESQVEIDKVSSFLKNNPETKILITGHTDNVGSMTYNQELSEKRAKSVYDALVKTGVAKERLDYEGRGMNDPVVEPETDGAHSKNRRIEFEVL